MLRYASELKTLSLPISPGNWTYNSKCIEFDEWELPGGETLCEEIDDFDADHTIGLGDLYVVDIMGSELHVMDINDEQQVTVDVRMLSDGVGFVVFKSDKSYVISSKVVVQSSKK